MGKQWKQCQTIFGGAPKSLQMVTAAMKLKDGALLGFFKDGSIRKWLERLKELDNGSGTEVR